MESVNSLLVVLWAQWKTAHECFHLMFLKSTPNVLDINKDGPDLTKMKCVFILCIKKKKRSSLATGAFDILPIVLFQQQNKTKHVDIANVKKFKGQSLSLSPHKLSFIML